MRQLSGALFRVVKPQDPGTHDLVWCENRGSSGFCVNYTVCVGCRYFSPDLVAVPYSQRSSLILQTRAFSLGS